jgi:hypothetical protein
MTVKPYDYAQRGAVQPISWEHFHGLCKELAVAAAGYARDLFLAVGAEASTRAR